MTDITWADVVALDASFSTVPAGLQTFILAIANTEPSEAVWGTKQNIGRTLLAAHLATDMLEGASSASVGAVLSESVGDVSRTYSDASATSDAELGTTVYGTQYLRIMRTLPCARLGISA